MKGLAALMQQAAQGVVENQDSLRVVVGEMVSQTVVRCSPQLTLESVMFTQVARERELKAGDHVLVLLDSSGGVVVDRIV